MNDYDTKPISCFSCKTPIGEVDFDAEIIHPLCGKCANPKPEGDQIIYTVSHFHNISKRKVPAQLTV